MRIAAAALTLAILAAIDSAPRPARERLEKLEARVRAAIKAGDQQTRIAADKELLTLLNGSPQAVEALARAYAAAGDKPNAIAALNRFANLGLSDDGLFNATGGSFSSLESLPEYKQVLDRFRANRKPVSLGVTSITLSDPGLLAEDIDYDPSARAFLVTSVLQHKIVRATLEGKVTDFATSPDRWPMLAVKIDVPHGRVWAAEVALDGFTTAPKDAWGRSAVLCFDLKSGKLLQRIEGPAHSALGDMVLDKDGEPIVSDGQGGRLYRVANGALRPIDTTEFISPQTPVLAPSGDAILVPDYMRGIARLDLLTSKVSWFDGSSAALIGVDGLYLHGRSLILTQNGTSPQRILLLELDPSLTSIISSKVIEQGTPTTDPTHGVFVGDDFFYIANSGWNLLDDHGEVKPGSHLAPAIIMRYSLK